MNQKLQGIVKFYNSRRGFGIITCDRKDYFVHWTMLETDKQFKTLFEDEIVEFIPFDSEKGLRAKSVRVIPQSNIGEKQCTHTQS